MKTNTAPSNTARKRLFVKKIAEYLVYRMLQALVLPPLFMIFRPTYHNKEVIRNCRGGAVLLANHQSNVDPFLVNAPFNRQIRYLVSDSNMRGQISKFIFTLFRSIPKSKMHPDYRAIKRAFQEVRDNNIIGIFPEGNRTWNGAGLPLLPETAKLIKMFGVNLFMAEVHGAYFAMPRWGGNIRRGPIHVTFRQVYTADEIKEQSTGQILARIRSFFEYNEYSLQKSQHYSYKGGRRAEYCETLLFVCPLCHQTQQVYSHNNEVRCRCGASSVMDKEGFLWGSFPFATLYDWDRWQQQYWKKRLQHSKEDAKEKATEPEICLRDSPVRAETGYRDTKTRRLGVGALHLTPNYVEFKSDSSLLFKIEDIEGNNIQNGEKLEFYYQNRLYLFDIQHQGRNAYKWDLSINIMRELVQS